MIRMEQLNFHNDNEPETMLPIGLAALAILNRLRIERTLRELEQSIENEADHGDGEQEQPKDESDRNVA